MVDHLVLKFTGVIEKLILIVFLILFLILWREHVLIPVENECNEVRKLTVILIISIVHGRVTEGLVIVNV